MLSLDVVQMVQVLLFVTQKELIEDIEEPTFHMYVSPERTWQRHAPLSIAENLGIRGKLGPAVPKLCWSPFTESCH